MGDFLVTVFIEDKTSKREWYRNQRFVHTIEVEKKIGLRMHPDVRVSALRAIAAVYIARSTKFGCFLLNKP